VTELAQKNKKLVVKLLGCVAFMSLFVVALVPLYNTFCEITGLNGKGTGIVTDDRPSTIDTDRLVTVQFITQVNPGMPWSFEPLESQIKVYPGEIKKVMFRATNMGAKEITGQAIPSVTPGLTATYFKKTECFCFNQQVLKAGESVDMPVAFFVDPELPKEYGTITLSYSLFNVTQAIEQAELASK
tara:strand:- start:1230 stop:1787 length:558 start_codon:yes stop_codon:yes gene_type:complete